MSVSRQLLDNVEALLRGEQILPIDAPELEQCEATAERWAADRAASERAEQRRVRAVEMRDAALGKFPGRVVDAALGQLTDTTALRSAREYLLGRKLAIVLAGGVGTGKTTAATWIALEAGGSTPGFIRASTLERRGRYSKGLDAWLESRSSLVIDDLGAEVLDGHGVFRSLFDEVIDTFYSDGRRLVVTSNLQPRRERPDEEPQFGERYGSRVASRLAEIGLWASCGARDLRRDQLEIKLKPAGSR